MKARICAICSIAILVFAKGTAEPLLLPLENIPTICELSLHQEPRSCIVSLSTTHSCARVPHERDSSDALVKGQPATYLQGINRLLPSAKSPDQALRVLCGTELGTRIAAPSRPQWIAPTILPPGRMSDASDSRPGVQTRLENRPIQGRLPPSPAI